MEGREGREPLSRDDPRYQEALEKVGETIAAKFFDPTVAYTNEWSRLVNTPSSESEPATDEGGWSTDEEDEESEED